MLLGEALKGAQQEGAATELIRISENSIQPCDGCRACWDNGECHIQDDMQQLYHKLVPLAQFPNLDCHLSDLDYPPLPSIHSGVKIS